MTKQPTIATNLGLAAVLVPCALFVGLVMGPWGLLAVPAFFGLHITLAKRLTR